MKYFDNFGGEGGVNTRESTTYIALQFGVY